MAFLSFLRRCACRAVTRCRRRRSACSGGSAASLGQAWPRRGASGRSRGARLARQLASAARPRPRRASPRRASASRAICDQRRLEQSRPRRPATPSSRRPAWPAAPRADSRSASLVISGGVIALPSSTPPLITSSGLALAKSRRPLAASTASPSTNAIAVGPVSSDVELVATPGLGGRDLGQGVLDDRVRGVVPERPAQLGDLLHGQAAVLGEHRAGRVLEPLGDLGHRGDLLGVRHVPLCHSVAPMRRSTFCVWERAGDSKNAPARGARGGNGSPAGCAILLSSPARDVRTGITIPAGAFGHRDATASSGLRRFQHGKRPGQIASARPAQPWRRSCGAGAPSRDRRSVRQCVRGLCTRPSGRAAGDSGGPASGRCRAGSG